MQSAVEVVSVVEGSPADRAGLRPEDLIVELDGTPTAGVDEVQRLMVEELIGRPVPARVVREGRLVELRLVPEEMG
jgi:S1-C subfamily serine protease